MKFACGKCGAEGNLTGPIPKDADPARFRCAKCAAAEMLADIPAHMKRINEVGGIVAEKMWDGVCQMRLQLMETVSENIIDSAIMNASTSTLALAIMHAVCAAEKGSPGAVELFNVIRGRLQGEVEKLLHETMANGMVMKYDTRPETDSDDPTPRQRGEITG